VDAKYPWMWKNESIGIMNSCTGNRSLHRSRRGCLEKRHEGMLDTLSIVQDELGPETYMITVTTDFDGGKQDISYFEEYNTLSTSESSDPCYLQWKPIY